MRSAKCRVDCARFNNLIFQQQYIFVLFFSASVVYRKTMTNIFVNQVGYLPKARKIAVAEIFDDEREFFIKDSDGSTVFTGRISDPIDDKMAGGKYARIDFSAFEEKGRFTVCYGKNQSLPFSVADDVYVDLYKSVLRYFTLSRCGEKIEDGEWGHPACHSGLAEIYGSQEKLNVDGGWHDAGDYGRYIVAGVKTVMDLLLAHEVISKDNVSTGMAYKPHLFDILSEVRFELEWMLKMQREDGAVYHKVSCYHFCRFIMPQDEKDPLVIAPVSTAATADFAGCLSYASKFYEKFDKAFAEKLMSAAIKAQEYLDTHEDVLYENPPEITTGGYGDRNPSDEKYFALCSLFARTGKKEYFDKAMEIRHAPHEMIMGKFPGWAEGFGWGWVAGYGTEILLKTAGVLSTNSISSEENESVPKTISNKENPDCKIPSEIVEELKFAVITEADRMLQTSAECAFGVASKHIGWGSNGALMDSSHLLYIAYELTGDQKYKDAANLQFHYMLGVNPLDFCYVSGSGTNSLQHPHHRPSGALGKIMPGMLAGGPSAWLADEVAKKHLEGRPPLKSYIDDVGSFCTNEVAIYWNSPFVLGLARLM